MITIITGEMRRCAWCHRLYRLTRAHLDSEKHGMMAVHDACVPEMAKLIIEKGPNVIRALEIAGVRN